MRYNLLGKQIRGRFGLPSGEIATNTDTARLLLQLIPQLGFYVGKSTTIEPLEGNPEDIIVQPTPNSLTNAVGYTNPGLEATVEGFCELKEQVPDGVFLMPQIGESTEERFAYCAERFDKLGDVIDGIELNVSCPHAKKGGILIGSNPEMVYSVVSEVRKVTKNNLVVKINAGVPNIEKVVLSAINAGANAVSGINSFGYPNPELSNQFGGLSGAPLFPATLDTARRIRDITNVPMIMMGGLTGASDIRKLDKIDKNFFYAIGTALTGMDLEQKIAFFHQLEIDMEEGTDKASEMTLNKMLMEYKPFIVKDVTDFNQELRLVRFYENLSAGIGQYVFVKVGNRNSKPFSVANDKDGLEIVVRKVGETTSKIFELNKNSVVRIRGPYGKSFNLPDNERVIYVGGGCGIAPVHHAAMHHQGRKIFIVGAKNSQELVYLNRLREMGEIFVSTDDGSQGYHGFVTSFLTEYLQINNPKGAHFFNCGPEIAMKKADEIERRYTSPEKIYHLVERMTSCGAGICGKCSIPSGKLSCVDGPVFTSAEFTPGQYKRDKTGRKVAV